MRLCSIISLCGRYSALPAGRQHLLVCLRRVSSAGLSNRTAVKQFAPFSTKPELSTSSTTSSTPVTENVASPNCQLRPTIGNPSNPDLEPSSEPATVDWKSILTRLEGELAEAFPKFFNTVPINLDKHFTEDIVYEDKVFDFNTKGNVLLRFHQHKVRFYFFAKSPYNGIEYCGSTTHLEDKYFFTGNFITVLYRLNSLRNGGINALNPLAWVSKKWTKKPHIVEGAMDFFVNADGMIYKIVHRKMTPDEMEMKRRVRIERGKTDEPSLEEK